MSFIWNFFGRCFQREYQFKTDFSIEQQTNVPKKFESSTVVFCNMHDHSTCLVQSGTDSGNAYHDASLIPMSSSPYHLRNWELDPSTVFNQSFDRCEIFGPFYDRFITPSSVTNHAVSFFSSFITLITKRETWIYYCQTSATNCYAQTINSSLLS